MMWINVKDKLPDTKQVMASFIHEEKVRIEKVIYDKGSFTFQNIPINALVTHWMPLREAAIEDKKIFIPDNAAHLVFGD